MGFGFKRGLPLLIPIVLLMSGCGDRSTLPQPSDTITVTFSGTLAQAESAVNRFTVRKPGIVNVSVLNLAGVESFIQATGGLAVGTWNGTACVHVVRNESATFGTLMRGSAIAGEYCVSLYDLGNFVEPVNYSVQVDHP